MIEEDEVLKQKTQEEKMKRMRTALKAVGGWFSYLMGNGALLISIFNPWGIEYMSFTFGVIILSISIFLLYQHTKEKKLEGLFKVSRRIKFMGGFILIPGFIGYKLVEKNKDLNSLFAYMLIFGIISIVLSSIIKKQAKKTISKV